MVFFVDNKGIDTIKISIDKAITGLEVYSGTAIFVDEDGKEKTNKWDAYPRDVTEPKKYPPVIILGRRKIDDISIKLENSIMKAINDYRNSLNEQ